MQLLLCFLHGREVMSGAHAQGPDVAAFLALVVVVAVVAAAVRLVRVPYTVALVLTGLALAVAPGVPSVDLTPEVILTVFLPVLLFHVSLITVSFQLDSGSDHGIWFSGTFGDADVALL